MVDRPGHGSSSSDAVVSRRLGGSSSGEESDSTAGPNRIFLIQRGHMLTPRVLASAVLAKTQVLAAGGAYHFMFKSAHQRNPLAPSTASALSLALLHDSLGSAHVSHITALDIVTQFPGLVEWSSDFGLGGYEKTSSDAFDYALYIRLKKGELAGVVKHKGDADWEHEAACILWQCHTLFRVCDCTKAYLWCVMD